MADRWDRLGSDARQALLLMYPATFGNLNGVPVNHRAQANAVRVHGELHTARQQLDGHHDDVPLTEAEVNDYIREQERLSGLIDGLETASAEMNDNGLKILHLDTDGTGQVAGMYGTLDENTEQVHTNVPGSERDLSQMSVGLQRTQAIMDSDNPNATGIYWQGMDTPPTVASNVTHSDEEIMDMVDQGARDLAGFDHAVNLEIDSENTRTTYDAHSFAAAVVGTAAKSDAIGTGESATGLQADAVTLAGPVGFGTDVHSRDDLANQQMEIYWIETRADIVADFRQREHIDLLVMPYTEHLEGVTFEQHMVENIGATRLESGLADVDGEHLVETPEGMPGMDKAAGGHGNYFMEESDSMGALQAVAQGGRATEFIDDEIFAEFATHKWGGAYNVDIGDATEVAMNKEEAIVLILQHHREDLIVEIEP